MSGLIANLGLLLIRAPIGVLFAFAGYNKFKGGIKAFVDMALPAGTRFMPEGLARAYLTALPAVEILVGAMLALGLLSRVAGFLASAMLVSFIMAMGVGDKMGGPFNTNFIYLGTTLGVLMLGGGNIGVDSLIWRKKQNITLTKA